MNWHPSEEDLVLSLYGDLASEERERLDRHVATCTACRSARDGLRAATEACDTVEVPEPSPGFERALWARVAASVPSVTQPLEARRRQKTMRQLVPAGIAVGLAAATALLVVSIVLPPGVDDRSVAAAPGMQERVLLTALDDHFARTELLLVELLNAPGSPPDLAFERAVADDLVASGRLHRDTALERGEAQVTAVLDDLEAVLVEVARGPDLASSDLDLLRLQIDEYGLLFKVRAVGDRIRDRREGLVAVRYRE